MIKGTAPHHGEAMTRMTTDEIAALPTQQIITLLAQISLAADQDDYSWDYDTFLHLEAELVRR